MNQVADQIRVPHRNKKENRRRRKKRPLKAEKELRFPRLLFLRAAMEGTL